MDGYARTTKRKRAPAEPFRGLPGSKWEGGTNEEVLAAIVLAVGGPLVAGSLYRLEYGQGDANTPGQFIGEYLGATREMIQVNGYAEPVLPYVCRNPVLPADAQYGTQEHPLRLWPLDVQYIAPAEPGDLDVPMHYHMQGEPEARPVGRTPVQ